MICSAGICEWCGCHFRKPSDVLYHRCAAMQQEALDECGAIHDGARAVCTLPAGHDGDHANRQGYWMPRPGERNAASDDEQKAER